MDDLAEKFDSLFITIFFVGITGVMIWAILKLKSGGTDSLGKAFADLFSGQPSSALDFGSSPEVVYVAPTAVQSPTNPTQFVSPDEAAAQYSLSTTTGGNLDLTGMDMADYTLVTQPPFIPDDNGSFFNWLQANKVF